MSATPRTTSGLAVLAGALCFGVVVDVLGNVAPDRVNIALGFGTLLLTIGVLAWRGWVAPPREWKGLGVLFVLLLAALIWRDSPTLFALNVAAIIGLLVIATPWVQTAGWRRMRIGDGLWGAARLGLGAASGAPRLVRTGIDWQTRPFHGAFRRAMRTGIGLAMAVPIVLVFGALLAEADPAFDRLISSVVRLDHLIRDLVLTAFWSWLGAGVLRTLLLEEDVRPHDAASRGGRFGLSEIGIVLAGVDVLFLGFVLVQMRYLFGGSELVRELTGLSYAEYARQGFFELVTVAALALPLLLVADWLLDKSHPRSVRYFRILSLLMLLLLVVILASALQRMRLYTHQYGLTELRLYTSAFMGWLTLVFGWFAATVLRGQRRLFTGGALATALLVLGALNIANPDAVIARVNLARAVQGIQFDEPYAASLSADALPVLIEALPSLPQDQRCRLSLELRQRWGSEQPLLRWNLAFRMATAWGRAPTMVIEQDSTCLAPLIRLGV